MKWVAKVVAVVCVAVLPPIFGALPSQAGCDSAATLGVASENCKYTPTEVKDMYTASDTDGFRYRLRLHCYDRIGDQSTDCVGTNPTCLVYDVQRQPVTGGGWTTIGQSCLAQGDLLGLGTITPELVATEFRKLKWPQAQIVVEPVGGETLVNFPTNFYTENTEPTTQGVTLLGTQITIEATPTSYTWHFDGGNTVESDVPGRPAPNPDFTDFSPEELEQSPHFVTHRYAEAHITVQPSVDVTYSGRYRVGGGPWTAIPDTLTVAGATVDLGVIEATPRLVG